MLLRKIKELTNIRIIVIIDIDYSEIENTVIFLRHLNLQSWKPHNIYIHINNYDIVTYDKLPLTSLKNTYPPGIVMIQTSKIVSGYSIFDALEDDRNINMVTAIIGLDVNYLYDSNTIEVLVSHIIRNPVCAYGFEGMMIDIDTTEPPDKPQFNQPPSNSGTTYIRRFKTVLHSNDMNVRVRSAAHWVHEEAVAVDLLLRAQGLVYLSSFIDTDTLPWFVPPLTAAPASCVGLTSLEAQDMWLSSYLASRRIPRIQLKSVIAHRLAVEQSVPWEGRVGIEDNSHPSPPTASAYSDTSATATDQTHVRSNKMPTAAAPTTSPLPRSSSSSSHSSSRARDMCATTLLHHFQLSWSLEYHSKTRSDQRVYNDHNKYPINGQNISSGGIKYGITDNYQDPQNVFEWIPPVSDLPGFSWQADWDLASDTGPCTAHLMTRVVDHRPFLGTRQYMGLGQQLCSVSGQFCLQLVKTAQLCVYDVLQADSGGSTDINGPVSGRKQKCVGKLEASPNDAYYAAVTDTGDLCIYILVNLRILEVLAMRVAIVHYIGVFHMT